MDSYREDGSDLPSRPEVVTPSPQHDAPQPGDSPRVQHFDLLVRHQQSQVSQSDPDLFTNTKALEASDLCDHSSQWADNFRGESLGKGQFELIRMLRLDPRDRAASRRIYFPVVTQQKVNRVAFIHRGFFIFIYFFGFCVKFP